MYTVYGGYTHTHTYTHTPHKHTTRCMYTNTHTHTHAHTHTNTHIRTLYTPTFGRGHNKPCATTCTTTHTRESLRFVLCVACSDQAESRLPSLWVVPKSERTRCRRTRNHLHTRTITYTSAQSLIHAHTNMCMSPCCLRSTADGCPPAGTYVRQRRRATVPWILFLPAPLLPHVRV